MTDSWLVIPQEAGAGVPAALDDCVLDLIHEDLVERGLTPGDGASLLQRIRKVGVVKMARMLWFSGDDLFDPDGEPEAGLRDDEDYLAWWRGKVQAARAEVAEVMRMAVPGARTFDEPALPRERRRRWVAQWLAHRAAPEAFPAPESATLQFTMQGLRDLLYFPRPSQFDDVAQLVVQTLAAGGHPFAELARPRCWFDDIYCVEARSLGKGSPADWGPQWQRRGGPFPRIEVRVYLPTRDVWLPAAPWTSDIDWVPGQDDWKALPLDGRPGLRCGRRLAPVLTSVGEGRG